MVNLVFIKRIFTSKAYWLSILAAIFLLMCSIVYIDGFSGTEYTLISVFYDEVAKEALDGGDIFLSFILQGYDTSYLWMFCPIIVGIPCIIVNKTERFVLYRSSKNKYFLSKYFVNLLASGCLLLLAYIVFAGIGTLITEQNVWDELLVKKFFSVFCWGVYAAIPSIVLSEFVHNKYLILCIPFVLNYFMIFLIGNIIPYEMGQYINPNTYQLVFLFETKDIIVRSGILVALIVICAIIKKVIMERRCDCGQR